MSKSEAVRLREMAAGDMDFALGLFLSVGWAGEGREILEAFLAYDPHGCFFAESAGEPAGLCCATRYRTNGFIGELIVAPRFRRLGAGRLLFGAAVEYLRAGGIENIYLDGDLNAVPYYEIKGFRKLGRSLRFRGRIAGRKNGRIRSLRADDLDALCALDRDLFGDDRSFFLCRRLGIPGNTGLVLDNNGRLGGYIMARPGEGLYSVGPWASLDGPDAALALLEHLAVEIPSAIFRLGPLENNPAAVRLLRSLPGLTETEPSWYMVKGNSERLGRHPGLYAIGSAAKG